MNRQQAHSVVAFLSAAFPQRELPEETVELYAANLGDFDFDAAQRAVKRLITEQEFFPSVAVVRDYCRYEDRSRLERPALPKPEFTSADEEFVKKLLGKYWADAGPDRRLDALRSTGRASPEEIDRAAREKARAMALASTPVQVLEPSREAIPRHPGASECSGKPVRHKNGHLICTHCSRHVCPDDLEKGCAP